MTLFSIKNLIVFKNSVSETFPSPYHNAVFLIQSGTISADALRSKKGINITEKINTDEKIILV